VTGEAKVKNGTMKLQSVMPQEASDIPQGDPARKLLDVRTYKTNSELHEKVRHELAMIPYITTFDFVSFTLVEDTVILTGWTVRETNRSDAAYRAKSVKGVRQVINNIEALPLGGADMEIRAAVRANLQRVLSQYFWSNGSDVKIIVKNGNIILLGSVISQADSDAATIQARSVPLAFHVFNLLRVVPPKPKDKG
jgi:osmotically-inducible protein OsmY